MCFFQVMLLLGYAWAHLLDRTVAPRTALILQVCVLALALATLPIGIASGSGDAASQGAYLRLIAILLASVGLPFFALAANAPLLQAWFSKVGHAQSANAYVLYRASNAGSLAALAAYPFLVEPLLPLRLQNHAWTVGFALLAVAIVACGWMASSAPRPPFGDAPTPSSREDPSAYLRTRLLWAALAFVPSGLLVAFTTYVTTDLASAPLLWVIPLALYLLTFIAAFRDRLPISLPLLVIAQPVAVALTIVLMEWDADFAWMLSCLMGTLAFVITSLICHRELYERRPATEQLTGFYSVAVPRRRTWRDLLRADRSAAVQQRARVSPSAGTRHRPSVRSARERGPARSVVAAACGDRNLHPRRARGCLPGAVELDPRSAGHCARCLRCGAGCLFPASDAGARGGAGPGGGAGLRAQRQQAAARGAHLLRHAQGGAGGERSGPVVAARGNLARRPAGWRGGLHDDRSSSAAYVLPPSGPLARGLLPARGAAGGPAQPLRVGVVGLGAGAMACHSRDGDSWRFFELDPEVIRIATNPSYFTYLGTCTPDAQFIVGDARLTLAKEPAASFDYLVIDAFSSDAIPIHLLTVEAIRLYASLLAARGILALHVSNRSFDLPPIVESDVAQVQGLTAVYAQGESGGGAIRSQVVLIAKDPTILAQALAWPHARALDQPAVRAWTDHYSDIISPFLRRLSAKLRAL
jgi:hypothetical protein